MSDNEIDSTYISFSSISKGIEDVLEFKLQVDAALKSFSNSINSLSASILLYNKQLKTQHANNSICSSDRGKKKFCSNTNNNVSDECKNNNKAKNSRENSLFFQTDSEGRVEDFKSETELEKAERLLEYHKKHIEKLKEKQKREAVKLGKELSITAYNNNILDVNNNILYTLDNSSDTSTIITSTDSSNKKIDVGTKPSTPVLTIPTSSSKHTSNPNSTDTTTKKNVVPNHSTSTPQNSINISKSVITATSNNKDKKSESRIIKERKLKPKTTSNNEEKKKRKSDRKILQTTDPNLLYVEQLSEDSSSEYYSDNDVHSENDDHVDDTTTNVDDANATQLSRQSATAVDHGAFDSTSELVNNNNNKIYK
jgi:hypothetical protein